MKKVMFVTAMAFTLSACATGVEPLCDRSQPYDKVATSEDECETPVKEVSNGILWGNSDLLIGAGGAGVAGDSDSGGPSGGEAPSAGDSPDAGDTGSDTGDNGGSTGGDVGDTDGGKGGDTDGGKGGDTDGGKGGDGCACDTGGDTGSNFG